MKNNYTEATTNAEAKHVLFTSEEIQDPNVNRKGHGDKEVI